MTSIWAICWQDSTEPWGWAVSTLYPTEAAARWDWAHVVPVAASNIALGYYVVPSAERELRGEIGWPVDDEEAFTVVEERG